MNPGEIGPGTLVDHFRVIRLLGRGGRGEVHLARDTQLGRRVALKVARPAERDRLELLLAEARATARLAHPNIVTIHAVGQHEGRAYLALQYVEGDTLRRRVGSLGPEQCVRLGLGIARALDHAHAQGVMHRDLKPENILFGRDGQPRVVDFGLALLDGETPPKTQGTPAYLAPEQRQPGPLTSAVDIWAFGVVLHETATGKRPQVTEDGPVVEETAVAPVVRRCLEQDPERRPAAAELIAALEDLLPRRAHRVRERPPYPGLRAYTEEDAALYFGRERELDAVLETLRHDAGVAVVGPSGVGKTSLIQAGVIPRLREQGELRVIALRPGSLPLARLARRVSDLLPEDERDGKALAELLVQGPAVLGLLLEQVSAGGQLLLFVDQLEEIDAALDPADRSAFLEAVRSAASSGADGPVRVVLVLRDDRIGRLSSIPGGRELLEQVRIVPLGCPPPEDLRQALVAPLAGTGVRYEEGLVQEMVDAVGGEPTALVLLSFTARALWDRRASDTLRRSDYEALGGVEGALAEHAEGVLAGLEPGEVQTARRLLLRLASDQSVDEESLLAGSSDRSAGRVLERLAQGRLVVVHRGDLDDEAARVELVHGSLARRWPRLRAWLDEARGRLSLLQEVEQAAGLWDRRGRQRAELWSDDALAEVEGLLGSDGEELSARACAFVEESRRRGQAARRARRRLLLALCCAALLVTVAIVTLTRPAPSSTPRRGPKETKAASWARRQLGEGRQAFERGRYLEARARLRAALEIEDSTAGRALFFQLARLPGPRRHALDAPPVAAGFTRDGRALLVATARAVLKLDGRSPPCGLDERPRALAPLPDGEEVILLSQEGQARLLRLSPCSDRRLALGGPSTAVAVSSGDTVAFGMETGNILLARLPDLKVSHRLRGHEAKVTALAFSRAGQLLATAGADRFVRLWRGGATSMRMSGHASPPTALAFDAAASRLASGDGDGVVRIWRCDTGRVEQVLATGRAASQLTFTADGRLLVGTRAGTFVLDREGRIPGRALALSPDGNQVVTEQGQAVLVHRPEAPPALPDRGHTGPIHDVTMSSGRLATAGEDGTVRVWDGEGTQLAVLRGHAGPVSSVVLSPSRLYSGGGDGTVRAWSTAHLRERSRPLSHPARVLRLALAPDGEVLAVATADGVVSLWRQGTRLGRLKGHRAAVLALAFSPDGARLASGSSDRTIRIWRTDDLQATPQVLITRAPITDLLYLDIGRLVAANRHGEVELRWLAEPRRQRIASECGGDPRLVPLKTELGDRLAVAGRTLRLCRLDGSGCDDLPYPASIKPPARIAAAGQTLAVAGRMGAVVRTDRSRVEITTACRYLDGGVERWKLSGNRRLWRASRVARPDRLLATRLGCLTLTRGEARLHLDPSRSLLLGRGIAAIGTGDKPRREILLAGADTVRVFDERGRFSRSRPVGVGATAILMSGSELVVGYADGLVGRGGARTLRARHSAPVRSLFVGPRGVLFAGQAGGQLEGWTPAGRRFFHGKLHGAVEHLVSAGDRLVAVTTVGDQLEVDLGFFAHPYCRLLRKLWQGTPADGHRCARGAR
jgi:WD40 repeat protein